MSNYMLSIVVLTMNRKEQVVQALDSCVASKLPQSVEFVIVDNNSNDGTGDVIKEYINNHPEYPFNYVCLEKNLGVGGGRAKAFDIAKGKYLYFLDDDAVISDESYESFFLKPLEFLERNSSVASITTRIKDEILGESRNESSSNVKCDGKTVTFKFLGGSHFLRKYAFDSPLYFNIKYGSEEFAPSIITQDKGYCHVSFDDVYIIHKPKKNKWEQGGKSTRYINVQVGENGNPMTMVDGKLENCNKPLPNLYKNRSECYGCTACYTICSKNAIAMLPDEQGFLYPVIDAFKCIRCGMCKSVCPIL